MKKARMVLLLALLFGVASAFTSAKHGRTGNLYFAHYTSETEFTWVLIEGEPRDCFTAEEKACIVEAELQPDDNTKPSGYVPGVYDEP